MALLTTLEIIKDICDAPTTMESLMAATGLSQRQVQRHIEKANHLGAKIVSTQGRNARWKCENLKEITEAGILEKWIKLERKRSVI